MKPLVIYHANCTDGFGAAFAACCKLGDDAEYLPMHYSNDPLKDITYEGRDVYILDFSVPRVDMENLLDKASKVVWLDHHKTAFEMWCKDGAREKFTQGEVIPKSGAKPVTCHILLDNNKSGALLAWEYFHPEKAVPYLISRIDDRDRWQFKLADSKALHAGLQLEKPWTFERWAELVPAMGGSSGALANVISSGYASLRAYHEQVQHSAKKATPCTIIPAIINSADSYKGPWVWSPDNQCYVAGLAVNTPNNISEVGHELANASGTYGLVWYYDGATGRANCSLRSNGDYDVSAIAKVFGGGGHKNAAGFNIGMPTLLGWLK